MLPVSINVFAAFVPFTDAMLSWKDTSECEVDSRMLASGSGRYPMHPDVIGGGEHQE